MERGGAYPLTHLFPEIMTAMAKPIWLSIGPALEHGISSPPRRREAPMERVGAYPLTTLCPEIRTAMAKPIWLSIGPALAHGISSPPRRREAPMERVGGYPLTSLSPETMTPFWPLQAPLSPAPHPSTLTLVLH